MKIYQSWKMNTPTTDGYSLTVTYVYTSRNLHEIEEVEKKLPKGMIVMDTDSPQRMYPLEQEGCEEGELKMEIKRIQLEFADPRIQARNHIRDICSAVENASHNLFMRHRVQITPPIVTDNGKVVVEIYIPDKIKRRFSIGYHLRGISKYLLDKYGDRYKKFQVGKRLLHYFDITEVSTEKNND